MSKKKAIMFGLKTAQNPSAFTGFIGVILEIIICVSIIMLLASPLFYLMYGVEAINGYAIIVGVLVVIGLFIFYGPSNNNSKQKKKYKIPKNREAIENAKEIQHKRLGEKSHYKRCPSCNMLVDKYRVRCNYCHTLIGK